MWASAHTEIVKRIYSENWVGFGEKPRHKKVAKLGMEEGAWPAGMSDETVAKKIANLCAPGGSLSAFMGGLRGEDMTVNEWQSSELRRLEGLIRAKLATEDDTMEWATWTNILPRHKKAAIKAKGKELFKTLRASQQCVINISSRCDERCPNTRESTQGQGMWRALSGVTAQVLALAGVSRRDLKKSHYVCPDHGHDHRKPLGSRNCPCKPSAASRGPAAAAVIDGVTPPSEGRTARSPQQVEDRKKNARLAVREAARREEALATRLATAELDGETDPTALVVRLQAEINRLRADLSASQDAHKSTKTSLDALQAWKDSDCPKDWSQVDDEYIKKYTVFERKAVAQAFFEAFMVPNSDNFVRWEAFRKNHKCTVDEKKVDAVDEADEADEAVPLVAPAQPESTASLGNSDSSDGVDEDEDADASCDSAQEFVDERASKVRTKLSRTAAFRAVASDRSKDNFVRPRMDKRKRKAPAYTPHSYHGSRLTLLQEFFLVHLYLRRALPKDIIAMKYFGSHSAAAMETVNSVLRTWICATYEILSREDWWVQPGPQSERVRRMSTAFEDSEWAGVTCTADCTNFPCQGNSFHTSNLIQQQLYSSYYKCTCGKGCIGVSCVGGCVAVSLTGGGPMDDHECLDHMGIFDGKKWDCDDSNLHPRMLYDAGVSATTKTAAQNANFDLLLSGIVRHSKQNPLSARQRTLNKHVSSRRIRVENIIGIIKNHAKIITSNLHISELAMMDKIFYICCMLHNFRSQKIF